MNTNTAYFYFNDVPFYQVTDEEYLSLILKDDEESDINYNKALNLLGDYIVSFINDEFKTDLNFIKVVCPQEYNFERDKIKVGFNENDLNKLMEIIFLNDLTQVMSNKIMDYTTATSGYTPFYSMYDYFQYKDLKIRVVIETLLDYFDDELEQYLDIQHYRENVFNDCVSLR